VTVRIAVGCETCDWTGTRPAPRLGWQDAAGQCPACHLPAYPIPVLLERKRKAKLNDTADKLLGAINWDES
jgi:hypothetical protein